MRLLHVNRTLLSCVAVLCLIDPIAPARSQSNSGKGTQTPSCPSDDSGLELPAGFCATVFADGIGHARHMVVAPSGVVYVNTWSGEYYGHDVPHAGGFVVALQDKTGAGKAGVIERFGETVQTGGAGGTGIGMYKGSIYVEINDRIVRYGLPANSIVPRGAPETIVSGLPLGGDHPMPARPTPARSKTGSLDRPAQTRVPNLRPGAESGVMTRIKRTRRFRRPHATQRGYAMLKALPSTPPAGYS